MLHTVVKDYIDRESWHRWLVDLRRSLPLVAALIAPLSVLFDIPALTQPWYGTEDENITDDKVSLILSAFSLFTNLLANAFLMARFSVKTDRAVKLTTHLSTLFWLIKPTIAITNLVIFGVYRKQVDGAFYLEGFWCAVVSCALAGISALALLSNYAFEINSRVRLINKETRSHGRGFMLNVTAFVSSLAIQALVFSKIEKWTYLTGIYFSLTTALTIGFGDLTPTTTAGKILIAPFAITAILQFATLIAGIISFFQNRVKIRQLASRKKYRQIRIETEQSVGSANLASEIALLEEYKRKEERDAQIVDLFYSIVAFTTLWLLGALIFSRLEGFSFGNGLYFSIIVFLTIGYGDFTPESSAGKVVFIVFAIVSVPVITSFVVQTLSSTLSLARGRWRERKKNRRQPSRTPLTHTDFVRTATQEIHLNRQKSFAESTSIQQEDDLVKILVELMLKMDVQTRTLLDMTLKGHDKLVLRADTLVQARNSDRTVEITAKIFDAQDVSTELNRYRQTFAQAIATASALKGLTGEERRIFERVQRTSRPPSLEVASSTAAVGSEISHLTFVNS